MAVYKSGHCNEDSKVKPRFSTGWLQYNFNPKSLGTEKQCHGLPIFSPKRQMKKVNRTIWEENSN